MSTTTTSSSPSASPTTSPPPSPTLLDNTSPSLSYLGPWRSYSGDTGLFNATDWHDGTFTSCGGNKASNGTVPASSSGLRCDVRVPFEGTSISLFGDTNRNHGVFSCRLERQNEAGQSEAEGTWGWFYGGSQSNRRPYQLNATLCSITGIPSGKHTLVLGVEPDQVQDGIAFDYASFVNDPAAAGTSYSWSSLFNNAVPPAALRNTTATPSLPASTSSSTSHSSSSAPSNTGKGINAVGLAVGVSLGGACAIGAAVIFFFLWRKRQKRKKEEEERMQYPRHLHERGDSGTTFAGDNDEDSVWFPGRSEGGTLGAAAAGAGSGTYRKTAGEGGGGAEEEKGYSPASATQRGSADFATLVKEEGQWQGFPQDSPPATWRVSQHVGGGGSGVYAPLPTGGGAGGESFAYPAHTAPDLPYSAPPPSSLPYSTFPPPSPHAHPPFLPPHHPPAQTTSASFASTLVTPAPVSPPLHGSHRASLTSAPAAAVVEELPWDARLADPDEFRERV